MILDFQHFFLLFILFAFLSKYAQPPNLDLRVIGNKTVFILKLS